MAKVKKPARGLGRGLSALMEDVGILNPETTPDVALETKSAKGAAPQSPAKSQNPSSDKTEGGDPETEAQPKAGTSQVNTIIAMDRLGRNPDQPRRYFDTKKLEELSQSIKDKGVLQPILVRPVPRKINHAKKHYQIVAGERRWQAALMAGLDSMPVLIRNLSDQAVLEIGVVENVQRADLNPIEEAMAYKALTDQFGRTQDDIAKAIGKSRPHIANMLRLLTLPERAQAFLQEGRISAGHARAIIAAPDPVAMAEEIVAKNLSVREAEDWVRRLKAGEGKPKPLKPMKDADTRKVEADLAAILGLKVDLRHKSPGGELRLGYQTGEQLNDLIKRLKK